MHRLQNAIRHGLTASPKIVKLIALGWKVASHLKHSTLATNALNAKQMEMKPKALPKNVVQVSG